MSRISGGDVVVVKPVNNVYTVMLIVATLAQVLALLVIFIRFRSVFGTILFSA